MPAFLFRVPVPFLAVEVKRRSRYRGFVEFPEGTLCNRGSTRFLFTALTPFFQRTKQLIFLVILLNSVLCPSTNIFLIKNSVFVIIHTNPYPHLLLPSEDPTASTARDGGAWGVVGEILLFAS